MVRHPKDMQMFLVAFVAIANMGIGYWAARLARRSGVARQFSLRFRRAMGISLTPSGSSKNPVTSEAVRQTLNEIEQVEQSIEKWIQRSCERASEIGPTTAELTNRITEGADQIRALKEDLCHDASDLEVSSEVLDRIQRAFHSLGELLTSTDALPGADEEGVAEITTSVKSFLRDCGEARGQLNAMLFERLEA